jgi:hypothetical protein
MNVYLTNHARTRCEQMGASAEECEEAFRDYFADYPSPSSRGHRTGNRARQGRNGLVLVYALKPDPAPPWERALVVTVMWRHDFEREVPA